MLVIENPVADIIDEPASTALDPGYRQPPAELLEVPGEIGAGEGRVNPLLRQAAQLRDGNAILKTAAQHAYWNTLPPSA